MASCITFSLENVGETTFNFDNSGHTELKVPGFGHPFDIGLGSTQRFQHGIEKDEGNGYPRMTAREVAMLQVMDALTEKPNWRRKVFDEKIVANWRVEAAEMPFIMDKSSPQIREDTVLYLISDKAFDWCITELRDRAKEERYTVTLDGGARCVKADGLVSEELHSDLNVAIKPLLERPTKDWHPGSNEQVLNLVHPSLYPLVYAKTRVLATGHVNLNNIMEAQQDTIIAPAPTSQRTPRSWGSIFPSTRDLEWSKKFQWLPCEVEFLNQQGTDVKVTSYINNLPFKGHEKLYNCVEKLIGLSIPLWNEVLEKDTHGESGPERTPLRILASAADEVSTNDQEWQDSLPYHREDCESEERWNEHVEQVAEYLKRPDRPENKRGNQDTQVPHDWATHRNWGPWQTARWKFDRLREVIHPEPFYQSTYEDWKAGNRRPIANGQTSGGSILSPKHEMYTVSLQDSFRKTGLQVIVKIASIELTPEKPAYGGGSWHLEGMLNEHIVATAIYYFDVNNITESRIHFRQPAWLDGADLGYEQGDFLPLEQVFGIDDLYHGKAVQDVGSIRTPQGRLLVFPNTRQHKVGPFELVDKAKPGHRRFLVLWLVDPHYRILSTRNVPPQQYDWWVDKARKDLKLEERFPREVQDMIEARIKDGTMSWEEAETYRLELMEERTRFTTHAESTRQTYNFCEH